MKSSTKSALISAKSTRPPRTTLWRRGIAAAAVLCMLGGCTDYRKASDRNFLRALRAYYSTHDECLYPSALRFPYELNLKGEPEETRNAPPVKGLDALAKAGLLDRVEEKSIGVKHYSLTTFGARVGGRFCYGHREVTGIEGFTPPTTADGKTIAQVQYRYRLADLPTWADSGPMRDAFPALAAATASSPEGKTVLQLTPRGWVVPEPE